MRVQQSTGAYLSTIKEIGSSLISGHNVLVVNSIPGGHKSCEVTLAGGGHPSAPSLACLVVGGDD